MTLTITHPAPRPSIVTVAGVKARARVEHDEDDALINACLGAALDLVETVTGLALTPRTVTVEDAPYILPTYDRLGATVRLRLPVRPVREITSAYAVSDTYGEEGTLLTAADDALRLEDAAAYTSATAERLRVTYEAGYTACTCPAPLAEAVLRQATALYAGEDDPAVGRLLAPYALVAV